MLTVFVFTMIYYVALMVYNETESICERVRQTILLHTSGIVLLTVIVNSN